MSRGTRSVLRLSAGLNPERKSRDSGFRPTGCPVGLHEFLEQVARRGSWLGGGSAAALCAALAAALLEKLVVQQALNRRMRRIRRACTALIPKDATMFSRVIAASRRHNRGAFRHALKAATEVPWQVFDHAKAIQAACRAAQRSVKPRFQSDLRCALALALASSESARTLIYTNLAWLNDAAYTKTMRRRLQSATH